MDMQTHAFKVKGLTPGLLQHNPRTMLKQGNGGLNVKRIPTPEEEAELACYRLDCGQLYIPALGFQRCLVKAATGKRFGKRSAPSIVAGAVFVAQELCLLVNPETGEPVMDYEIKTMRAVVQRQGVMRSRPLVRLWATTVLMEVDHDFIPDAQVVLGLLREGGLLKGVGDYRPECTGPYGRFEVELVE